jgi:hypothetical protein
MLERDLQKESCLCSKIVLVNRSSKARSSLLKEPKTANPMGMIFDILRGDVSCKDVVEKNV